MYLLFLLMICFILKGISSEKQGCDDSLGLQDGRITDSQLTSQSAYNDDFLNYGAHQARLNKRSWPPGYRARQESGYRSIPWIKIELSKPMVITSIATQGYGDDSVSEWIESYMLMYSDGTDFYKVTSKRGLYFKGNNDRHRVQLRFFAFPVVASSLLILPTKEHNNVALRMELYGCEPGYYFVVWLMVRDVFFYMKYLYPDTKEYQEVSDTVLSEISYYLQTTSGFVSVKLQRLSPKPSEQNIPRVTAEFEIYCLQSRREIILFKLQQSIREGKVFVPSYIQVKYPVGHDCLPPIINIGLSKTPIEVQKPARILSFDVSSQSRCNDSSASTIITCVGSGIHSQTGLFKFFQPIGQPNVLHVKVFRQMFGYRYVTTLAYIMCTAETIVNGAIFGVSYDYGFYQMYDNKLVAKVRGPAIAIKGMINVTFNARQSRDFMEYWRLYKGLNFTWFCLREGNVISSTLLAIDNSKEHLQPNYYSFSGVAQTPPVVRLDINKLTVNQTYTIKLNAQKGKRNVSVFHQIKILPTPKILLRCLSNCGHGIERRIRKYLFFSMSCSGVGCNMTRRQNWSIIFRTTTILHGSIKEVTARTVIRLESNTITGYGILTLRADVDFGYGLVVSANYSMPVGQCFVIPKIGKVLHTQFRILCKGWQEETEKHSAQYELILGSNHSIGMILQSGKSPDMVTVLSVGDPVLDHTLNLSVRIRTLTGVPQTVGLAVKVKPIRPVEVLDFLLSSHINATDFDFMEVLKQGNIARAADIAIAALSVFKGKYYSQNKEQDRTIASKVKRFILRQFQYKILTEENEVRKLAYVVSLCAETGDQILLDSQEHALKILSGVADFMMSNLGLKQLNLIRTVSTSILNGVDNIVKSASSSAKKGSTHKTSDAPKSKKKARDIVQQALALIRKISSFLSSIVPLHKKLDIESTDISMLVTKGTPTSLGGRVFLIGGSRVVLPSSAGMFVKTGLSDNTVIACKILILKTNPFTWHESAQSIKTYVLDVTFEVHQNNISKDYSNNSANSTNNKNNTISTDSTGITTRQDLPYNVTKSLIRNVTHHTMSKRMNTSRSYNDNSLKLSNLSSPVEFLLPQKLREHKDNIPDLLEEREHFVKVSTNTTSLLTYHKIYLESDYVTAKVTIMPFLNVFFDIYVSYKERPTPEKYNFTTVIPDLRSCQKHDYGDYYFNCTSDPYMFSFSYEETGHSGLHYLGIRYMNQKQEVIVYNNDMINLAASGIASHKVNATVLRVKRSTELCGGTSESRQKRSCLEYKNPPTEPPPASQDDIPEYDPGQDANYTLKVTTGACMFWHVKQQKWSRTGCALGPNSTSKHVHCVCTHMTSFGGIFFVPPNPIDYDKVWMAFQSLGDSGNIAVLATVCAILTAYVIGLVVARRADRKDRRKVINKTIRLHSSEDTDTHAYKVLIQTGVWRGSGTSARVGLIIYGENGCTDPISLSNVDDGDDIFFARGSLNIFQVLQETHLGSLTKIQIWHDNSGESPNWFINQVIVIDKETERKCHFLLNRWLATDMDDGMINAEVKVFTQDDAHRFKHFFMLRSAKGFANDHLWASVFTRPPQSPFTRCQRLSCCMSILFAAMITSAMFYNFGVKATDTLNIGPLKLNLTDLKIGIQSTLIATPINAIIVILFTKVRMKEHDEENTETTSQAGTKRNCIPRVVYLLAWFLCISTILVSTVFVLFYSMQWGKEISDGFLVSVVVFVSQDIFIKDPIKVVLIACLLSVIFKKLPEHEETSIQPGHSRVIEVKSDIVQPSDNDVRKAREFSAKKKELYRVTKEVIGLVILFVLFMIVCYGNRGESRYMLTKSVEDVFKDFSKVHDLPSFWNWSRTILVPGLCNVTWYNGEPFDYKEGFISNRELFLLGMPRFRQVRIKPDESCHLITTLPRLARFFSRCLPTFSDENAETEPYYMPLWQPVKNLSQYPSEALFQAACPKPWRYQSRKSNNFLSSPLYTDEGYIAELGYNSTTALKVMDELESKRWIDDLTAAVFVEFTVFEPSHSLFSVVKYTFYRITTGESRASTRVQTLAIYSSPDPQTRAFNNWCKFLLLLFVIVCVVLEIRKMHFAGCKYFKNFFNWVEFILLSFCISAMVMNSYVEYFAGKFVKKVQESPFHTWSNDDLVFWSEIEVCFLGFIIFILTLKLLKLLGFNRCVSRMISSLQSASKPLFSFSIIYIVAVVAFSMFGNLAFGENVSSYSTLFSCIRKVMENGAFGGDIKFKELQEVRPILGPFYILIVETTILFILVNMFIVIMNFTYSASAAEQSEPYKNVEIAGFGKHYYLDGFPKKVFQFFLGLFRNSKLRFPNKKGKWRVPKTVEERKVTKPRRVLCYNNNKKKDEESSNILGSNISVMNPQEIASSSVGESRKQSKRKQRRGKGWNCTSCNGGETDDLVSDDTKAIRRHSRNNLPDLLEGIDMHMGSQSDLSTEPFNTPDDVRKKEVSKERKRSSTSLMILARLESMDDIEFPEDDFAMSEIIRDVRDISSSLRSSLQNVGSAPNPFLNGITSYPRDHTTPTLRRSDYSSSCTSSYIYSSEEQHTLSCSATSLVESNASMTSRNVSDGGSEWSFNSDYYRVREDDDENEVQDISGNKKKSITSLDVYEHETQKN